MVGVVGTGKWAWPDARAMVFTSYAPGHADTTPHGTNEVCATWASLPPLSAVRTA